MKNLIALPFWKRFIFGISALFFAASLWFPTLSLFFKENINHYYSEGNISPKARLILNRHLKVWMTPFLRNKEITNEHISNPEWDFMWRTFFVLSMANVALQEPQMQKDLLPVMDQVIEDTISLIENKGLHYFLMEYAKQNDFVIKPPRSLFHDGEIALMIGVRRLVQEKDEYRLLHKKYLDTIIDRMSKGPILSAESYPDECWTFCNTVSLVAVRISDILDGGNHSEFIKQWIRVARQKLIHPKTGLLVSAFTLSGDSIHGPEGSTIWMAAHCLSFVDEAFARDQYSRAKQELIGNFFGFGYSSEWPRSWRGTPDCDAGGLLAIAHASPSATGFTLLAARTFNDKKLFSQIISSLNLGGLPLEDGKTLKFSASNLVGDAVILYSLVEGPVRERMRELVKHAKNN